MKWVSVFRGIFLEISIDALIACCLWWDGYQYKSAWLYPVIEEELSCKQQIGNYHDTHALAMRNIIDEDMNFWTCSKQNTCQHRICAVRFLVATKTDEVAIASSILCIVKGNRQCSSDLPQHKWASIFLVRRIYYLCSNPTNKLSFHFSASFRARYFTCTKMKIGEKKLANCCDSPNSPKFFPLQSFLLYGMYM